MHIGPRNNHNRPSQPFFSEIFFKKLPNLSSPFTDQAYDIHIRIGVSGHHSHQNTFTDTRTGKDTHSLSFPATENTIQRPDSKIHRFCNTSPIERIDWIGINGIFDFTFKRSLIINRAPQSVYDSSQQVFPHIHTSFTAERHNFASRAQSLNTLQGHQQHLTFFKTNHLSGERLACPSRENATEFSDRGCRAVSFHNQSNDFTHFTINPDGIYLIQQAVVSSKINHILISL